jgi:protoporphyrinogen oxidase
MPLQIVASALGLSLNQAECILQKQSYIFQVQVAILGASLAGLSCSFHIGQNNFTVFEKKPYFGGHTATHRIDDCLWDEGPHLSFTKIEYVKNLFSSTSEIGILEQVSDVSKWFQGHWIPHPAKSNLYAAPKLLATECLDDFIQSRQNREVNLIPQNYADWLDQAFGKKFASSFPYPYTRKYWTCDPQMLTVDWIGQRMFRPDPETIKSGYIAPPNKNTYYFAKFRYPEHEGFAGFLTGIAENVNFKLNQKLTTIDVANKKLLFANGDEHYYDCLVNTMPLPVFIALIPYAPSSVKEAADSLHCSSVLLINIKASGPSLLDHHWLYVYDEDMLSTRITQIHHLSPNNCPDGSIGIQVEVYESKLKPFHLSHAEMTNIVTKEVAKMGLIHSVESIQSVHTQYVPYANVIFTEKRRESQEVILD